MQSVIQLLSTYAYWSPQYKQVLGLCTAEDMPYKDCLNLIHAAKVPDMHGNQPWHRGTEVWLRRDNWPLLVWALHCLD